MRFTVHDPVLAHIQDLILINQNLVDAWKDLQSTVRNQDSIVSMFNASQEAFGIAMKCSNSDSIDNQSIQSIENLLDARFDVRDVKGVTEGVGSMMKDAIAKFIQWIKELFAKLRIWVKTLINKMTSTFTWLSKDKVSVYLRSNKVQDAVLTKATTGIIGKSVIDAIQRVAADSKSRKTAIRSAIESDSDNIDSVEQSMLFASSPSMKVLDGKLFSVSDDMELVTVSDKEYEPFSSDSEKGEGLTIAQVQSLEDSARTLSYSLVEFETEANDRSSTLAKQLETMTDQTQLKAAKSKLLAISKAVKKNGGAVATICTSINAVLKKVKNSIKDGSGSADQMDEAILERMKGIDFSSPESLNDARYRIEALFQTEFTFITAPNKLLAPSLAKAFAREFSKHNIEFFEDDNGELPSNVLDWYQMGQSFLDNASAEKLKLLEKSIVTAISMMRMIMDSNFNPTTLRKPADAKVLVLKVIDRAENGKTAPENIIKFAEYANKFCDEKLIDENDDYEPENTTDLNELKAALQSCFSRKVLNLCVAALKK